jgi:hypothetical protein
MGFDHLLERFAAAAAAGDGAGFAALFSADGCYDDGFFGLHRGREAITAMLARFHVGGEQFRWQFFEPLATEQLGYARYCFSYRSKQPQSLGGLVVFEGMARLQLREGLIADYAEVFDRGMAFVQLGYEAPRVHKLLQRYAQAWRDSDAVREHLRWRQAQEAAGADFRIG